jgi:8-oxo-dGTP pyrophosphatase MutT (NUDIX family)
MVNTRMPEDPLAVILSQGSQVWPEDLRCKMCENLKAAGVLIPIIEYPKSLSILLTQRSADLKNHASEISFPGGRMESIDTDISETALRETCEEVGIRPEQVDIAGYLQPMLTMTGYAVTAIVGLIQPCKNLTLDRSEVEHAFEVPLPFFLDERNQQLSEREVHGVAIQIVEFNFGSMRIWGATANMLVALRNILLL